MSGASGAGGAAGDQFYVTHCSVADSVLNNPGYSVRAASVADPGALDAAFHYPPYELPIDMWRRPPAAEAAPRRLARTADPAGGVWVVHSAYLAKDTVGRDRSYFSHLLRLPAADPEDVLRAWGSGWWATRYPPGAPKALARDVRLLPGPLVSDAAVTAFLGDAPAGPTALGTTVWPPRLRAAAADRRALFARMLQAVLARGASRAAAARRLYVHAEPGLVALLLYGAVRVLPPALSADLTFSTFEPNHRSLRDYKLADVVGTYLGSPGKGLDADLAARDVVLDTFAPERSSAVLREPLEESLPDGLSDLIDLAAGGQWPLLAEMHSPDDRGDDFDRVAEAGMRARAFGRPAAWYADPALLAPDEPFGGAVAPRPAGATPYSAQISRTNPACLLFLIDQSGSMAQPFCGGSQSKAATVADSLNRLIQNVVLRSAKADGVRDYFRVGVIGYGKAVTAGLGGTLPFNILIPASELGEHPLRVETRTKFVPDGAGGLVEQTVRFPVWYDAAAGGPTPMCEALAAAGLAVKEFVEAFPDSYPPIVLNLTDGMPTDGNPQASARLIRNLSTGDGDALLFNLLISSKPVPPDYFPADEAGFADNCPKLLFRMSSVLPPKLWEAAKAEGHALKPGARGVVINADPTAIVRFLDIGTRVTPAGK